MDDPKSSEPQRASNRLRPMKLDQGLLNRADGSVRWSQGGTSVLVAVFGPLQVGRREELIERATVQVVFKSLTGSGANFDTEKAAILRQSLESVILTALHPRTKISIVVQVLSDDGCLLAAAMNATCVALLDAGIPCKCMVSAVSMCVSRSGELMLDPTKAEEADSVSTVTIGFTSSPKQGNSDSQDDQRADKKVLAQGRGGILMSDTRGVVGEAEYLRCCAVGRKASSAVQNFLRLALSRRVDKAIKHT